MHFSDETLMAYADGELDRATGAPTSCLNLTWSAAAFLQAAAARDAALQAMAGSR